MPQVQSGFQVKLPNSKMGKLHQAATPPSAYPVILLSSRAQHAEEGKAAGPEKGSQARCEEGSR
jgi:hypothetical protein